MASPRNEGNWGFLRKWVWKTSGNHGECGEKLKTGRSENQLWVCFIKPRLLFPAINQNQNEQMLQFPKGPLEAGFIFLLTPMFKSVYSTDMKTELWVDSTKVCVVSDVSVINVCGLWVITNSKQRFYFRSDRVKCGTFNVSLKLCHPNWICLLVCFHMIANMLFSELYSNYSVFFHNTLNFLCFFQMFNINKININNNLPKNEFWIELNLNL